MRCHEADLFPKYLISPFPWTGPLLWGTWSRTSQALLWSLLQGQPSWTQVLDSVASQVALVVKNPPADAGDRKSWGSNPWVRKVPWRRKWLPTAVLLPGEWIPRTGAWRAMVHRVSKSWTQLSDLALTLQLTAAVPPGLKEAALSVPPAWGHKSLGSSDCVNRSYRSRPGKVSSDPADPVWPWRCSLGVINMPLNIHTMKYYSAVEENKMMPFAVTQMT